MASTGGRCWVGGTWPRSRAAALGTMLVWALPTAAALGERHVRVQDVGASAIYFVIAATAGVAGSFRLVSPASADEATVTRTILATARLMAEDSTTPTSRGRYDRVVAEHSVRQTV